MPLTDKQIETLFTFTKEHGVIYYDLQAELVDHLASSIEEELHKDASLTPFDALQRVYSSFGKNGFIDVIKERQKALEKGNLKLWWQIVANHFTIPKIFLTIVVFAIAYSIAPYLSGVVQGYVIQSIVFGFPILQLCRVLITKIQASKSLLLLQQKHHYSWLSFFLAFVCSPVPSNILLETQYIEAISSSYFATWLTIIFVIEHSTFEANNRMRQKAQKLYPQAFVKA